MNRPFASKTALSVCLFALATLLLAAMPVFAQVTSGTIFGSVQDPTGAYVKDANVTIANPANGLMRKVKTNEDGQFVAPNLLPGSYTITVEAAGFKKLESSGFALSAADKLNAGILILAMGTAQESVTVTADAGQVQLQTNSGERSDIITGKQLNDVAVNGRNVLDYLKLVPGMSSTGGLADFHVSGTGGNDAYAINGTRSNQHEFTIDGASNVDTGNNGGTHITINTDAIEEVKVLTSNYQAEFGKAAGGQVAVTTKSGTNQWHGNGRFFHRHEGFNANEWFNKRNQLSSDTPHNDPTLYRYNDIGYQIGGPIVRDRLFVFWGQEFYRQLIPIGGTVQFYTPTQLERNGDFSQSTDGNGNPITISGPGITGNVINPAALPAEIQPVYEQMQKILNLYPVPNVNGFGVNGQNYNYAQSLSADAPRREDILRVDFQLNSKHRIYGRWVKNTEDDDFPFLPFPGPYGSGFACSSPVNFPGGCKVHHPTWNASGNVVSTLTPTLLNEFSIGPSHTLSLADGVNGNVSRGANGINLQLLFPVGDDQSIPDLGFGGIDNVAFQGPYLGATPWKQANTTINLNDNLTWVWRNHNFKTGLFYQRNRKDQIAWGNINGQFGFGVGNFSLGGNDYSLGDPLASALLGFFNNFSQSTARPTGYFRYHQLEFYVQDTWRLTPRLTLDYGMRFAWIPPQYDAKNQIALFDPGAYNPSRAVQITNGGQIVPDSGDPLNGMLYSRNGDLPKGGWNSRGIMPEPRFGFAFDLWKQKTVLRGGVGMMHDRVQGNLIFNTVFNNPAVVQTLQVSADHLSVLPSLTGTNTSPQGDKNIIAADRSGKVPTVYSYSIGIQHQIASGTTLDVAYVGTQSRHLVTSWDLNSVPYGFAFSYEAQDPANYADYCEENACDARGIPTVEPNLPAVYANAGYNYSGAYAYGHPSYTNAPLVPFKGYGQIAYLNFGGTANYNSLQASLQRRFSKGLTMGAVYTWSKSLTTANADQDYQDPFRPRALDYRSADWDRTHVFAFNYVYDIPGPAKHFGGPKWLAYLTDNYQLSGVTNFMTGTPVDLNNGWQGEPGAQTGGNMWGIIPNYYTLDASGNPIYPTIGAPIRGSRDRLRSNGLQNWDVNLLKNIPFGERYSLQLRLEAYNVFNHPNFNNKNYGFSENGPFQWTYGSVGSGSGSPEFTISKNENWGTNADTYNNTGGPGGFRVLQLGAKFYF